MPSCSKSEVISADTSSGRKPGAPVLSLRKVRQFSFGPSIVPLFYVAFVICFWATSSPRTGMSGELAFPVLSDEQSWWEALFYGDPIRVYTNLFYQAGYLLSQAIGVPG